MAKTFAPASELELAETIAAGGAFDLRGTGTKLMLGRPMAEMPVLSLAKFKGVEVYEPEELIFEAGAATPLSEARKLLAAKHQMLAFEPPDFSMLLGSKNPGTLGGMLATGLAGPRRIKAGSVRDHVLGVRGVTGKGEIFKAGARVMKNVTGYDVPKLMAGSWGTLAAFTGITFKVLPAPESESTLVIKSGDPVELMSKALQSSCDVSGAAHVPGRGTYLRLEGISISVRVRQEALAKLLGVKSETLGAAESRRLWASIRDVTVLPFKSNSIIWRVSVPPSDAEAYVRRVFIAASGKYFLDWGGGLVWLALEPSSDGREAAVRGALKEGHAMLFRAPEELRRRIPVFQPQSPALASLSARVKAALDPLGKLNPSRMVEDR
jgi:glycolate oxidase FAD binding subunit